MQVERQQLQSPSLSSYFVSLSGFSDAARAQEEEAGDRMTLLDASQIVRELVLGRVIVSRESAAIVADKCLDRPASAVLSTKSTLLIHDIGWIWAFFFRTGGKHSHFTLIHADGHGLASELAETVIDSDQQCGRLFSGLSYLTPLDAIKIPVAAAEGRTEYLRYLEREFGRITLEGLPADQEVGSKTIKLESIYVPLTLRGLPSSLSSDATEAGAVPTPVEHDSQRISVSSVLQEQRHIAILAPPGGGKTTLLKRLAVAYAVSERRDEVDDNLPRFDWLPLFIRCRQLGDYARRPVTEIIKTLAEQAERPDLADALAASIAESLKAGKVLLLIDGLDEINDVSDRSAFAGQLRAFISTYPATHVVVTSREAGFRSVAGAMSSICALYKIADLSAQDIRMLCRIWHREVTGGAAKAAEALADSIIRQPRVRELAVNPLLLTTLLLVQRWLGELPAKRSVLYGKAIEVLLMTWNTEGHTPIDQDEAIPQLAYAAFSMMSAQQQNVSAKKLKDLFDDARKTMPEVLAYARMSSGEFIERVEDRSSLLVRSGHVVEDGQLRSLYEFKHLTFQEYLTALACVESWNPWAGESSHPDDVLDPHLDDESWSEVVPLAAVLGGSRSAKRIVDKLINALDARYGKSGARGAQESRVRYPLYSNLLQCLADEVQISPEQVRRSLDALIKYAWPNDFTMVRTMRQSRFSGELPVVAWEGYQREDQYMVNYGSVLASIFVCDVAESEDATYDSIFNLMSSGDQFTFVKGVAALMVACFSVEVHERRTRNDVPAIDDDDMYFSSGALSKGRLPSYSELSQLKLLLLPRFLDPRASRLLTTMAMWALSWMGELVPWSDSEIQATLNKCLAIWQKSPNSEVRRLAAWAIMDIPLALEPSNIRIEQTDGLERFLKRELKKQQRSRYARSETQRASVVISYYCGMNSSDIQNFSPDEDGDNKASRWWHEKLAKIQQVARERGY